MTPAARMSATSARRSSALICGGRALNSADLGIFLFPRGGAEVRPDGKLSEGNRSIRKHDDA